MMVLISSMFLKRYSLSKNMFLQPASTVLHNRNRFVFESEHLCSVSEGVLYWYSVEPILNYSVLTLIVSIWSR